MLLLADIAPDRPERIANFALTAIFAADLCWRWSLWLVMSPKAWARASLDFLSDPFRFTDFLIVALDVGFILLTQSAGSGRRSSPSGPCASSSS